MCVLYGPPWQDKDEARECRDEIELRLDECADVLRLLLLLLCRRSASLAGGMDGCPALVFGPSISVLRSAARKKESVVVWKGKTRIKTVYVRLAFVQRKMSATSSL